MCILIRDIFPHYTASRKNFRYYFKNNDLIISNDIFKLIIQKHIQPKVMQDIFIKNTCFLRKMIENSETFETGHINMSSFFVICLNSS